jgi:glucokinase
MMREAAADRGLAVGIDIGGSKIAAGLVDLATGAVLAQDRVATDADAGARGIVAAARGLALRMAAQAPPQGRTLRGVGIGLCELIDRQGRIASRSLADWPEAPFPDRFAEHLPVRVVADVRAAALAELRFGALQGCEDALFVSIGTGISACLVIAGRPYPGARGAALVLTSAALPRRCPACGAVSPVCVEDCASGRGIETAYDPSRRQAAPEILRRAAQGEARAAAVVGAAALEAGIAIGQLANCTDPARIVVGGGLGCAAGPFWDGLVAAIRAARWSGMPAEPAIERAHLGPAAGLVGAALALAEGVH